MRLKFLQTLPSASPDAPFQAGQIIDVPQVWPELRRWIEDKLVAVIATEEEAAVSRDTYERAIMPSPKPRGRR